MARHDHPPSPLRSLAISGSLDPPPAALLNDPLEYYFVEHYRQRSLCAVLRNIAAQRIVPTALARRVATILSVDVPQHQLDEEIDLFPALQRRGTPEDDLHKIIARLRKDRAQADRIRTALVSVLSIPCEDARLTINSRDATLMASYAAGQHRHLAIENGILLVIARRRLGGGDVQAMSQSMKRRRGIHF